MKSVQIKSEIIEELLNLSRAILNHDYSKRIVLDFNDNIINEIASNLNLLADRLMLNSRSIKRDEKIDITHFIEVISAFANHDFHQKLPISDNGTILDAIATGINMLGDELQNTTASKEELELERNKLNEAQSIAKVGNWELNLRTKDLTGSKEFYRILELEDISIVNVYEACRKKYHPDDLDKLDAIISTPQTKEKGYNYEYRIICNNGSIKHISCILGEISLDINNEALYIKGTIQDITDRKNAEIELNDSFKIVTEQNKRLLNFSYIVSHNLRSHTSNITSLLSLLEESDSKEEKDNLITLIKNVSNLLNETMINLNDVVSIQKNINLVIEPLNLHEYIKKAISILNEQIVQKKAIIKNDIPKDTLVNYNPAYLESIVLNFISNAIKYSHPDRAPIVLINCYKENDQLVLQITDNGVGMDLKKYGHKLFGMYKTFHGNKDARGIGLFISKNQIETMGGKIELVSELGIGTTFKICII